MIVTRPAFEHPVVLIDGFLSEYSAGQVLKQSIELQPYYRDATVIDGNGSKVMHEFRKNDALYLDDLDKQQPGSNDIIQRLREVIWSEPCKKIWHEGETVLDTVNFSSYQQAVVSRYGATEDGGHYYHEHRDTRYDVICSRIVTLIYYYFHEPKAFSGGALRIRSANGGTPLVVEPQHNRAVVFPSFTYHGVEPTYCAGEWDKGRFSINYWLGFK